MPAEQPARKHRKVRRRRADMPLLGGVRPPVALLPSLLVVVCSLVMFTVGNSKDHGVSRAVSASQADIAADSARSLGASLEQNARDLHDAVGLLGRGTRTSPDAVLTSLTNAYAKWRGLAVVDTGSGRLLAARGENVPLDHLTGAARESDKLRPRLVTGRSVTPRLLSFAPLERAGGKNWLVVSSATLRLPDETGSRSTFVTDSRRGGVIAAVGRNAANNRLRKAVQDGRIDLRREGRGYLVIGRAEVPDGDRVRGLGLSVATAVPVPAGAAARGDSLIGPAAAGALLVTGLLVTWLLIRHVQRPLLRLHQEARRLAGGDVKRPVSVRGWGEAARVGRSLESLRRQLAGETGTAGSPLAPSRRTGLRLVVLSCAVLKRHCRACTTPRPTPVSSPSRNTARSRAARSPSPTCSRPTTPSRRS